ncbi:hypothetical protein Bca52824_052745 [Brassica carinata]|uniref:Uncharacterized protein n=1 Tax=Brassica carinata TaxID=52824 RepID=A0A8X7R3X8_BRACI|nr:hypothetical protein Bca52824_052745 [Brassica carinata]
MVFIGLELLNFGKRLARGFIDLLRQGVTYPSPVLRYATRLIGSLLSGQPQPHQSRNGSCASVPRCEAFATGIWKLYIPTATAFNMGAVLAANLAGYKGNSSTDRSNNIAWNYLDVKNLVSKEFIAGPHSRIDRDGPYVYVFQDRAKKTLYCHLPQIGLIALISEAAVEFLPCYRTSRQAILLHAKISDQRQGRG